MYLTKYYSQRISCFYRQQKETVPASNRSNCSSNGDLELLSRSGSPTAAEKDILRYYYYIHNGIDTEHVAPMEDSWLDNVLEGVPEKLRVRNTLTNSTS